METIILNVRDIHLSDRRVLENVIGKQLGDDQKVIIQVIGQENGSRVVAGSLPEWCNVFGGLSDSQIADLEESILQRADLARPSS